MHIINENYRDQNFIKKFDLSKYQEFLDGTYTFYDASGNEIEYDLQREGLFPKAWSRDYYGRALPNTQRGPIAKLPLGESAPLDPSVVSSGISGAVYGSSNTSYPNALFFFVVGGDGNAQLNLTNDQVSAHPDFTVEFNGKVLHLQAQVQSATLLRYISANNIDVSDFFFLILILVLILILL